MMDKFVNRSTTRGTVKRNLEKSIDVAQIAKRGAQLVTGAAGWHRCDSMTEAEHDKSKIRASPSKRKKLEQRWSPIKAFETLATIEEYPPLSPNNKPTKNEALHVKNGSTGSGETALTSPNGSGASLYDISLDYGNKSWADLYEEEMMERAESKGSAPSEVKNGRREKVKFKEDETLTRQVGDALKFDLVRKSGDSWLSRLRSPGKRQSGDDPSRRDRKQRHPSKRNLNADGRRRPVVGDVKRATIAKSLHWSRSPHKHSGWRKRAVLDEDSQNTMTEVAQITRSVRLKPRDDENSSAYDRPKRQTSQPVRYPLPETWVEPKLGWEQDPAVLERRDKDLDKGYRSEVYKKYISTVDKKSRVKGLHPRTPNKYLKMPRRSWDTQVRVWRRLLYAAVNADVPSDASFISSNGSETASEHDVNDLDDDATLNNDDQTIKASVQPDGADGPIDFAVLTTSA